MAKHDVRLFVRMPAALKAEAEEIAERKGVPLSEIVRHLLKKWILGERRK